MFLRKVLYADALASLACAALALAAGGFVAELTELSRGHLTIAGGVLVPFVLLLLATATRETIPAGGVKAIIGLNVVWVAASLAYLALPGVAPNALGYAFVVAQAVAVGVLAELEVIGLKRMGQEAAA